MEAENMKAKGIKAEGKKAESWVHNWGFLFSGGWGVMTHSCSTFLAELMAHLGVAFLSGAKLVTYSRLLSLAELEVGFWGFLLWLDNWWHTWG